MSGLLRSAWRPQRSGEGRQVPAEARWRSIVSDHRSGLQSCKQLRQTKLVEPPLGRGPNARVRLATGTRFRLRGDASIESRLPGTGQRSMSRDAPECAAIRYVHPAHFYHSALRRGARGKARREFAREVAFWRHRRQGLYANAAPRKRQSAAEKARPHRTERVQDHRGDPSDNSSD